MAFRLLAVVSILPLALPSVLGQGTITPVPVIPSSTSESLATIVTHTGPFDETTRAIPALDFFEKYIGAVQSLNLDQEYPDFYALNCTFYNTDGKVIVGGPNIAQFSRDLFSILDKIVINNHVSRVVPYTSTPGLGSEGSDNAQDAVNQACGNACTWVFNEHDLVFYLAPPLDGPGIPVRRSINFLLGPAQIPGQGTNGKQWYQAKVWFDQSILTDEIARRQNSTGQ
ncbi:hypothetical protein GQ53DRAFT_434022 [Thozetella sp. PMI_491]|nr:hypothetical protein GQ53DRAFT_434022 [Thozetella sp. PMI_491]